MPDWIPGVEDQLGWGFNIFGNYFQSGHQASSKLQNRLIDCTATSDSEVVKVIGKDYKKPKTVVVGEGHGFSGSTYVFETKEKVTEHWKEEAGVKGSYGAFSAGFKQSFETSREEERESNFCLREASQLVYSIELVNPRQEMIPSYVTQDPVFGDMQRLLDGTEQFSDAIAPTFFKFFNKYGTHIISSVKMGGYLNYYCSTQKSYSKDTKDFKAQVEAEYGALFSGSGSGEWGKVTENWTKSRNARIVGYGGNPSSALVSDVISTWSKGQNFKDDFATWTSSISDYPSPVGFSLYPIGGLFAGKQGDIMRAAYQAYANTQFYLRQESKDTVLTWKGQSVDIPKLWNQPFRGWIFFNRDTGKVADIIPQSYSTDGERYASTVPDRVKGQYNNNTYIVVFCWLAVPHQTGLPADPVDLPKGDLYAHLLTCGAGDVLQDFIKDAQKNFEYSYAHYYYVLAGTPRTGPKTGVETTNANDGAKTNLELTVPVVPMSEGYTILDWY